MEPAVAAVAAEAVGWEREGDAEERTGHAVSQAARGEAKAREAAQARATAGGDGADGAAAQEGQEEAEEEDEDEDEDEDEEEERRLQGTRGAEEGVATLQELEDGEGADFGGTGRSSPAFSALSRRRRRCC